MDKNWKLQVRPKARQENILQGEKYRITILTEGLIRLEYSEIGLFRDQATQCVWNRDFPKVDFRYEETEENLEIFTSMVHIIYDKKKFSRNGLSIQVIGNFSAYHSIWHYGEDFQDLKGTARTLDEADGAIPLERGIIGRNGFSLMDDSKSLLIRDDGWVEPGRTQGVDLYFWGYGHQYKRALKDFYYLCGKSPMVPRYALGNWWSRYYKYTQDSYKALMERFERENIPFSVAVIDMDWHLVDIDSKYGSGWTGYTWNRQLFPQPQEFLDWLHEKNMHVTLNIHPADGIRAYEEVYPEMARALGVDWEQEQPVNFDASSPEFMEACFQYIYHPMEEQGVDFWWLDWQSGGVSRVEGLDPLWMLNHYHYLDSGRDGKRPMTFSRYAGPGSHRYPIGFSGDTIVTWESLDFQPYFTSTASNIGYGMWSHDIGGHMRGTKDDVMAGRWLQLGVFSPVMRLHSSSSEFNGKEPWRYRADIRDMMKEFLRLRHKLVPYLYTMNHRAYEEDIPLVIPMYYNNPDVDEAYEVSNQYEFGDQLICAPVTTPQIEKLNVGKVKVWLPEGSWTDIFTGMKYRGGRSLYMYRDITSIPVLAKTGAILPMTDNLDKVGENPKSLHIHLYPGDQGEFTLYEDDNITDGYKQGKGVKTKMHLSWETKAEGFSAVFTAERPEGNTEQLPPEREYIIELHGVTCCKTEIRAEGETLSGRTTYHEETASVQVKLERISQDKTLEVYFYNGKETKNPVADQCFAFLNQAEIPFALKDKLYRLVLDIEDKTILLSQLQSMELDRDLLGVLTEIIAA